MIYIKTDKGRAALLKRDVLSLRERQVMVLCNGARSHEEMLDLFGENITEDIDRLERRGLLAAPLHHAKPPSLQAVLAEDRVADMVDAAAVAQPPRRFVASSIAAEQPPAPRPQALRRMSLDELTALADVPPVDTAVVVPVRQALADSVQAPPDPATQERVAAMVNSIDAEQVMQRSSVVAQAYMTQVLMALDNVEATELVETHGNVRHEVDILLYLAQGLGLTHTVAGEDVTLRVAMRVGRLLPADELPMLLDCVLDYVPHGFSVLLYEFVLAGRDTATST
ncbi:MAG: hypothetical protein Q4G70_12245 [Pseudomonadota bacterium]|nr:hypothetical protein [Pseudomonadota bacterium]